MLKQYLKIRVLNIYKRKALQHLTKGLVIVWLPLLETFGAFCMNKESKKVYQIIERVQPLPVTLL